MTSKLVLNGPTLDPPGARAPSIGSHGMAAATSLAETYVGLPFADR